MMIEIPQELSLDKVTPPGQKFKLEVCAIGVQVYVCRPVKDIAGALTGTFEWDLKEPIADLFDTDGRLVGRHFRDRENDGAAWLCTLDKSGNGVLSDLNSVHRLRTLGGLKPPPETATAAREGEEARVLYSATYYFNA